MNLKYIIHYFIFLGTLYSQCESYNIEECFDDPYCIWEENLVLQNCDSQQDELVCNSINECSWEIQTTYYSCSNFGSSSSCSEYSDYGCSWEWSWGGWGNHGSSCAGGGFQIDNSICGGQDYIIDEGICVLDLPPECSEMNETECSSDDVCEWVEDIEIGQCSQFDNSENSCTDYPGECFWDEDITYASCNYPNSGICNSYAGCYWDCYYGYCDCYGQQQIVDTECIGQYETDNSYCQEIVMPECSEMEQSNCEDDFGCDWVEDIDYASCSDLSISDCSQYFDDGCILDSDCIQWGSWYSWICYEYGQSYCTGGSYQLDNSYCEQNEYQLGDLNQDSLINIQDVILAINLILYGEFYLSADINLDSTVNVLDVIQIVNIILNN